MLDIDTNLPELSVDYNEVKDLFNSMKIDERTTFNYSNLKFSIEIYQFNTRQFQLGNKQIYNIKKKENNIQIGLPSQIDEELRKLFVINEAVAAKLYQEIKTDDDTITQIINNKKIVYCLADKVAKLYAQDTLPQERFKEFENIFRFYSHN